jgi:cysteine desulfurase
VAYLDHAATTPLLPAARAAFIANLDVVGNASSVHAAGRTARRIVEESREVVAGALGIRPGEVVFTSGGTEADNLAIKGIAWSRRTADDRRRRLLISAIEHHAVLDPATWMADHEGFEVEQLPVDHLGRLDLDALDSAIRRDPDSVAMISVMWANNEVGTVQPIDEIASLAKEFEIPVHSDAVQTFGWLPMSARGLHAVTVSGHKVGGPHGVGALALDRDLAPVPVLHGGGQERDVRSGTYDTAAIAGFAAAVVDAIEHRDERAAALVALREDLVSRVLAELPDASLNGDPVNRLPGNAHISFAGCEADAVLMLLDAAGVECSTGSACNAGIPRPSHVMVAMGKDAEEARSCLRFSLGHNSTAADVDQLVAALPGAVARARRASTSSRVAVS